MITELQNYVPATPRKPRPEDALANAEARLPMPIQEIHWRVRVTPNNDFSEMSVPARIEQALAHNRHCLANLPDETFVDELAKFASEALAACSEAVVKREAAKLIGSFPNAAIANPETYAAALVFDLLDLRIPDTVVVLTCRKLRRSCKFVPAISEVLATAEGITDHWRAVEGLAHELRSIRPALEDAVRRAEATLAFVQREISEGYRDPNGKILRQRSAYKPKGAA